MGFGSLGRSFRLPAICHIDSRERTFRSCFPANPKPLAAKRWKNGQELPLRRKKGSVFILLPERTRRANDLFHGKRQSVREDIDLVRRPLVLAWNELPDRVVDIQLGSSGLARDFRSQLVLRKFPRLYPGSLADEAQADRGIPRRATK